MIFFPFGNISNQSHCILRNTKNILNNYKCNNYNSSITISNSLIENITNKEIIFTIENLRNNIIDHCFRLKVYSEEFLVSVSQKFNLSEDYLKRKIIQNVIVELQNYFVMDETAYHLNFRLYTTFSKRYKIEINLPKQIELTNINCFDISDISIEKCLINKAKSTIQIFLKKDLLSNNFQVKISPIVNPNWPKLTPFIYKILDQVFNFLFIFI